MAPSDRKKSLDQINSNKRQEGAQSNNAAPSNDDQPQPLDPPTAERDQEDIPSGRISHVISLMTLRRNSNPNIPAAIPSPSASRFQPADEPKRRFERAVNMPSTRFQPAPESRDSQQKDRANMTLDTQPPQPDSSESPPQHTPFYPSWLPRHPDDLWFVQVIVIIILSGILIYYSRKQWMDDTPPANES
ncbi:hypothetical protein TKK_0003137 [Trichogramma kaykai]